MRTYQVSWPSKTNLIPNSTATAVVIAGDIGEAIEKLAESLPDITFKDITRVAVIENMVIINE